MSEQRLIDANALPVGKSIFEFGEYVGEDSKMKEFVYKADIDSAPTVNAVEVVRCKECRYEPECCRIIRNNGHEPRDYCSYGERRESEAQRETAT